MYKYVALMRLPIVLFSLFYTQLMCFSTALGAECTLALGSRTQDANALDLRADGSTLDVSGYFPGSNFLVEGNNVTRRETSQGPEPRVRLEMIFRFCNKKD